MHVRGRLDFDGVVANFYKAARDFYGIEHPKKQELDGKSYLLDDIIGRRPIDALMLSADFWENMDPYPWANTLVNAVDEIFEGDWCFVTKGQPSRGCAAGKVGWTLKNFPQHIDKFNLTMGHKKTNFCGSRGDILIDDWLSNIVSWREFGGTAFFWRQLTEDYEQYKIEERIKSIKRIANILKEK